MLFCIFSTLPLLLFIPHLRVTPPLIREEESPKSATCCSSVWVCGAEQGSDTGTAQGQQPVLVGTAQSLRSAQEQQPVFEERTKG